MANALHTYLVTDTVPELADLDRELPIIRDDYVSGTCVRSSVAGSSASTSRPLARAFERMPVLEPRGIRRVVRGAITHTPDGETLLGPSGVPGFWMACGAQVAIADGPGLGRELARWMAHGETRLSVRSYDPRPPSDLRCGHCAARRCMTGSRNAARCSPRSTGGSDRSGSPARQVCQWPTAWGSAASRGSTSWREECRAVRERVGLLELSGSQVRAVRSRRGGGV